MILTVTLNPAIDKLLILNDFKVHKLHRLEMDELSVTAPGGKGVNIALSLKIFGNDVITTGFAGGHYGHLLCDSIRQRDITTSFIFTEEPTRTNTSILDLENETLTELNDFGQIIPEEDIEFFMENYQRLLKRVDLVVLAGSTPRAMTPEIYKKMIEMANEQGLKTIVHTSPYNIDGILDTNPFLINPDMRSYHKLLGHPLDGIEQFIDVGKEILLKNSKTEFVIFTHRIENVVAVTREKSYVMRPNDLKIVNMLGYADAYLAGFIDAYMKKLPVVDVLKFASAAGLTNVEDLFKTFKTNKKVLSNIDRIVVEEL